MGIFEIIATMDVFDWFLVIIGFLGINMIIAEISQTFF